VKDWSEFRSKPMHQQAPRASKPADAVPLTVTAAMPAKA
jgi:hypothetical protein